MKGVEIGVYVKNGVKGDVELWIGGLEGMKNGGVKGMGGIDGGLC